MKKVKVILGALAIAIFIGCAILLVLAWHWGALTASPRAATAGYASKQTAMALTVDFEPIQDVLGQLTAHATGKPAWLFQGFFPYGGALFIDVGEDRVHREVCALVNPRRLGPLAPMLARRLFSAPPDSFQWVTEGVVWRDGVLMARLRGAASEGTAAIVRERWPEAPLKSLALEGGHMIEFLADNRGGEGLVAMECLADLAQGFSKPEKDAGKPQELQRIFDAQQLSGLFYRAASARITADVAGNDTILLNAVMECPDSQAASAIEFALLTVRDLLFKRLIEYGVVLEGDPVKEGTRVRMDLRLEGWRTAVTRLLEGGAPQNGRNAS